MNLKHVNHAARPRQFSRFATGLGCAALFTLAASTPALAGVLLTGDTFAGGGILYVGSSAAGGLSIDGGSVLDGATAAPPAGPFAPVFVGGQPGGIGTVTVDGAGSALTSASIFNVDRGTVQITGGGTVNAQTSILGFSDLDTGSMTVSGAGSSLNLTTGAAPATSRAFLGVGGTRSGRVDILAGGKITLDASPVGTTSFGVSVAGPSASPQFAGSNGVLNIDGIGSELRLRGSDPSTSIGRLGTGTLTITNGGRLIVEDTTSTNSTTFVGRAIGASGSATVSGAGSEWQTGRRLRIGEDSGGAAGGTGIVNVSDGGVIRAPLVTVGAANPVTGGGGTLTGNGTLVGNVTNQGVLAPGNSPGIMTVIGNVTLGAAGQVLLEIGGTRVALGEYDQLNAYDNPATTATEGTLTLGGRVTVSLYNGYSPTAGSFFDVFTALDILDPGNWTLGLPGLAAGLSWSSEIVDLGGREALRLSVAGATVPLLGTLCLLLTGLLAVRGHRVTRERGRRCRG